MIYTPGSIEEVGKYVKESSQVLPRGGGTKTALSTPTGEMSVMEMSGLAGILEYEPEEFTFTALAGTRLAEVEKTLAQNGQHLPFDPPFVERGATLGGAVASGLSGSGRYHYGGIRDFLLGVRFVDGRGEVVRGGGKVVKNVAGYDFSKLMVGSRGGLGVLVELSFKVFPKPKASATLRLACTGLDEAMAAMQCAAGAGLSLMALDLEATPKGYTLWTRQGGLSTALPERLERLKGMLGDPSLLEGPDEEQLWRLVREFAWVPAGYTLVKVPLTPGCIPALEAFLGRQAVVRQQAVLRRYFAGGQAVWLAFEKWPPELEGFLMGEGLSGLVVLGSPGKVYLGEGLPGDPFRRRIKDVLDPARRFLEV
jgi:glycolate oxidase FAD binding subunit